MVTYLSKLDSIFILHEVGIKPSLFGFVLQHLNYREYNSICLFLIPAQALCTKFLQSFNIWFRPREFTVWLVDNGFGVGCYNGFRRKVRGSNPSCSGRFVFLMKYLSSREIGRLVIAIIFQQRRVVSKPVKPFIVLCIAKKIKVQPTTTSFLILSMSLLERIPHSHPLSTLPRMPPRQLQGWRSITLCTLSQIPKSFPVMYSAD